MISGNLADIYFQQGDYPTAQRLAEEAAALAHEIGYKEAIGFSLDSLGLFAMATHRLQEAQTHFSEARKIFQELDDRMSISRLDGLGAMLAALQGRPPKRSSSGPGRSPNLGSRNA